MASYSDFNLYQQTKRTKSSECFQTRLTNQRLKRGQKSTAFTAATSRVKCEQLATNTIQRLPHHQNEARHSGVIFVVAPGASLQHKQATGALSPALMWLPSDAVRL